MHGAAELAEQVFDMPVKIGIPKFFGGLVDCASTPIHATGVGLIQYGSQKNQEAQHEKSNYKESSDKFRDIIRKMSQWVKQYV